MHTRVLLLAAVVGGVSSAAHAAVITVQSDVRDHEAFVTPSTGVEAISNGHQGDNRIGSRTTSTLSSSILPFALPVIPVGEEIVGATVSLTLEGEAASLRPEPGDGNLDLYGLPFDAAPYDQLASRQYSGPSDTTAGVVKLQDNIFTLAENPAEGTTLTKMSVDISDYIESLYGSANPGDFAVLRVSYDIAALSGNNRYRLVTSGGDGSTIESEASAHTIEDGAPFLTITTAPIPEPGSLSVLALGGLTLLARRRQR